MEVLTRAANILDVSEFEVLQRAYRHWFGDQAPAQLIASTFSSYMKTRQLPHWARHYAVKVIDAFEAELRREGESLQLAWLLLRGGASRSDESEFSLAA